MFNYYNSERSRDKEEFHIKSLIDVLSKYRWLTDSFNVVFISMAFIIFLINNVFKYKLGSDKDLN
jgi:hypothetical protein